MRPRHLAAITTDLDIGDVKDVVGVLDQVRAGAFSGRAVVRVAGGFKTSATTGTHVHTCVALGALMSARHAASILSVRVAPARHG